MGHIRLGNIPKRHLWKQVVQALQSANASLNLISQLTAKASKDVLLQSKNIESLSHCFWLFVNIAQAARQEDFIKGLEKVGIQVNSSDSGLSVIKKINDHVSSQIHGRSHDSLLDQIAVNSFNKIILDTISQESQSLFGCTQDTVKSAFHKYSTNKKVAELGREYFSEFTYNAFSFVLEKELANSISTNGRFKNSADIEEFNSKLKDYCWDISFIVEDFTGGWYGKHAYKQSLDSEKEAKGFTQYALEKLLSEMSREVFN